MKILVQKLLIIGILTAWLPLLPKWGDVGHIIYIQNDTLVNVKVFNAANGATVVVPASSTITVSPDEFYVPWCRECRNKTLSGACKVSPTEYRLEVYKQVDGQWIIFDKACESSDQSGVGNIFKGDGTVIALSDVKGKTYKLLVADDTITFWNP